jgi:hypothetical protein
MKQTTRFKSQFGLGMWRLKPDTFVLSCHSIVVSGQIDNPETLANFTMYNAIYFIINVQEHTYLDTRRSALTCVSFTTILSYCKQVSWYLNFTMYALNNVCWFMHLISLETLVEDRRSKNSQVNSISATFMTRTSLQTIDMQPLRRNVLKYFEIFEILKCFEIFEVLKFVVQWKNGSKVSSIDCRAIVSWRLLTRQ